MEQEEVTISKSRGCVDINANPAKGGENGASGTIFANLEGPR